MSFDRKAYMKDYVRDPKNREAQRLSTAKYRAKIASDPELLQRSKEKKKEYNASKRGKQKSRNRVLRYHYGISEEQYDRLIREQNYGCAICGGAGRIKRSSPLDVDHDHNTGKIRGLLCNNCNKGIGNLQEDQSILMKALLYLRRANSG